MNQLSLRMPISQPEGPPERREQKKATRCSQCKRIVWQEDTFAGLCPDCVKEHHAEILDDQVG